MANASPSAAGVESHPLNDIAKPANDVASIDNDNIVKLKPKITLVNGITVIVGSIIGSGIFITPKGVLKEVESVGLSLIIWLACGLFSMVGAYCYTELGTAIVRSGADYAYIFEAFGPFLAFLRLWVECMIVRPCAAAIVALTFANYVVEPLFPTCPQPEIAVRLLAAVAISELICFAASCYMALFIVHFCSFLEHMHRNVVIIIINNFFFTLFDAKTYVNRNTRTAC